MKKTILVFVFLFFTAMFNNSANAQEVQDEPTAQAEKQYDQNIKIQKKPRASFSRMCNQSEGFTRVLTTFDKSGKVTEAKVVASSGCLAFDSNAVSAAKKIKFTPAVKNGEPVTVKKQVQYNFALYKRGR